jgi:hypothetical protein
MRELGEKGIRVWQYDPNERKKVLSKAVLLLNEVVLSETVLDSDVSGVATA